MSINYKSVNAAGAYNGSAGAGSVGYGGRGASQNYTGVGDYRVVLDRGVDLTENAMITCIRAADDLTVREVNTDDINKQILVQTLAGAANESDVDWVCIRFAP